jgi:hypothetical protein
MTCVGSDPLAAVMERGRVGLMSTSLLAASGEPSRARILYTRVAGVLPGAVLRPSHHPRLQYAVAHDWVYMICPCAVTVPCKQCHPCRASITSSFVSMTLGPLRRRGSPLASRASAFASFSFTCS